MKKVRLSGLYPNDTSLIKRTIGQTLLPILICLFVSNIMYAQMPCEGHLNISLNSDCEYQVLPETIITGSPTPCALGYSVMLTDHYDVDVIGDVLTGAHLGQTITVKVINDCNGNSCWGTILVEDKKAPTIECEEVDVICLDMDSYLPVVLDNCDPSPEIIQIGQSTTIEDCSGDYIKTISREYIAKDHGGYTSDPCTQIIHILRLDSDNITYPADFINDAALECNSGYAVDEDGHPHTSVTGIPCILNELTNNGGFETTDFTSWNISTIPGQLFVNQIRCADYTRFPQFDKISSCEGSCFAVTSFDGNGPGEIVLSQQISVPSLGTTEFSWSEWIAHRFNNPNRMDRMYCVELRPVGGGATLDTLYSFTPTQGDFETGTGWISHSVDISNYAGQDIIIAFVEKIPDSRAGIAQLAIDCVSAVNKVNAYPDLNDQCKARLVYEDNIIGKGSCKEKIFRTWRFYDACTSAVTSPTHTQMIHIEDNEGPTINCKESLTVVGSPISQQPTGIGLNPTCILAVNIPPATASDNCSSVQSVGLELDGVPVLGTNGGTIQAGPGTYILSYLAYDGCNESDACETNLTVIDNSPPLAICDRHTVVGLTADGTVEIEAFVFDDGSFDRCGIDSMKIARTGLSICDSLDYDFGPTITFCCADVDQDVQAIFRVYDLSGSFSECEVTIEVQDKTPPNADCPLSLTIDCDHPLDINDLSQFGEATANNQCQTGIEELDPIINMNSCNNGSIIRRWRASDSGGESVCTQTISISNPYEFNYDNLDELIIKPRNIDTTGVCGLSLAPENLPAGAQRPEIRSDNPCDLIGTTYKDEEFIFDDGTGACLKLVRTWTILNWCAPEDRNTLQWAQVIKVTDDEGPEITLDTNNQSEYCNDVLNCDEGNVTLKAFAIDNCTDDLHASVLVDLGNDGIIDSTAFINIVSIAGVTEATIVFTYALGEHRVQFVFTDACGIRSVKDHVFTVKNCKAPTCVLNNLNINLRSMDQGPMECIWASDFDASSTANCNADSLSFYFDQALTMPDLCVMCNEIGTQTIDIYVVDEFGNSALCQPMLTVTDHDDLCTPNLEGPNTTESISGLIVDDNGGMIEDARVSLSNTEYRNQMTDSEGTYVFSTLAMNKDYEVVVEKDDDVMNGVSTLDLVLIQKHILGLSVLDDPYDIIAADINKSGNISGLDLVELRKLILGNIDKFQSNKSWRFIDKSYEFLDESNPLSEQFPEEYEVLDLATNMKVDFVGVKVGDVSGNVSTNNLAQSEVRSNLPLRWESNVTTKVGSNIVAIEITSENFEKLNGFQTTLQFQNSEMEFIGIEGGKIDLSQNNIGKNYLDRGLIAMSWSSPYLESANKEEVLFKLFFKLKGNEVGSIELNSTLVDTEVYFENVISNNIQLIENIDDVLLVDQNAPNPWTEKTEIRFESNISSDVVFSVYDLFGKLIHKESLSAKAGLNSVSLNRSDIVSSGIYLYELSSRGKKVINKMIIID